MTTTKLLLSSPNRAKLSEAFTGEKAPPSLLVREVMQRLLNRLHARQFDLEELTHKQMIEENGYVPSAWPRIERLEDEVLTLKGAIGALRWASGWSAEMDLELDGYVNLQGVLDDLEE